MNPKRMVLAEVLGAKDLEIGVSEWFDVDQARIDSFAEATEDRQWIHVDPEKAKESEFGGTIAHGFLIMSLLPKLFFEVVEFTDMGRIINFGVDKLRFMAPVPSGDAVRLSVRILSGRRRSGGILMRIRGEIHLRSTGRRALVTEMLFLVFPRD
jgi:acyl dehydratase